MGTLNYPYTLANDTDADADEVMANFNAARTLINGNIEAANIADNAVTGAKILDGAVTSAKISDGTVADTDLTSPNNSVYKILLRASAGVSNDATANTYLMMAKSGKYINGQSVAFAANTIDQIPSIYFDDADYTVGGKTQKLRVRAYALVNGTAPAITFTVGLYPITPSGGVDDFILTLGTVVPGSTAAIVTPSINTTSQANSGDFTIPADGAYGLGLVTSGTIANNSAVLIYATLQTRNV
jgi:hypothetical protein